MGPRGPPYRGYSHTSPGIQCPMTSPRAPSAPAVWRGVMEIALKLTNGAGRAPPLRLFKAGTIFLNCILCVVCCVSFNVFTTSFNVFTILSAQCIHHTQYSMHSPYSVLLHTQDSEYSVYMYIQISLTPNHDWAIIFEIR
jgi:hypothetical protein